MEIHVFPNKLDCILLRVRLQRFSAGMSPRAGPPTKLEWPRFARGGPHEGLISSKSVWQFTTSYAICTGTYVEGHTKGGSDVAIILIVVPVVEM